MNKIYFKTKYLFFLLGYFVCSVGMAQSPFPKTNINNMATAAGAAKEQVSKQTHVLSSNSENSNADVFAQPEQSTGIELSEKETESVKKQIQESQKLFEQQPTITNKQITPRDSVSTKVKSFAKTVNLTAKNIFDVKKDAFDLSTSDKMLLKSVSTANNRTLVTYQQLHNTIPVEGAIYKVRENKSKIDAFGSISRKLPAAGHYKISASEALENALKNINAKQYIWESKKLGPLVDKKTSTKPSGELVYVGPNFSTELKEYHLAWKFDIFATNPQSSQTVYVDANTGKTVLTLDLNRNACIAGQSLGQGKSRYSGNVVFNTKQYADGYRLESLQGKYKVPIYTFNLNHEVNASDEVITDFIDDDNIWNELHNKDNDEAAIDIHWGMQKTIDYYEEKFDRNSIDNKGMAIIGLAHWGQNIENASWTGGWAQFGDGNNTPFVGLGTTAHELTHGVTRLTAGLIYQGESGAMNESFSDIFGAAVEFYTGKTAKEDIWLLGNELYNHGSMRNMSNPKAQNQPDTYGGKNWASTTNITYDNGGVHINSGITNYWFYLLSEGGSGVNDLNNSYDIKAIGLSKIEKIAYLTLTEYLSPSSNFSDMRQATLMVTEDLYGLGSEEYKQVTNAWYAIGIGPAFSDKQLSIVSIENPSTDCGSLKGTEPFFIKVKNTGLTTIRVNENLNYKLRLMVTGFGGRLNSVYDNNGIITLEKDLAVGEETIIKIQDKLPYVVSTSTINYVEVKFDFKTITDFGTKDGISFVSSFIVLPQQKDFDIKFVGLNLPSYTGTGLTNNHSLAITLYNLGCQDIPAGSKLKIGYQNTLPGNETVWKEITLDTDFKKNSEMTFPFDGTIDLSAIGLHTYEGFVSYSPDPVAANNSGINSVYSDLITQFPYSQDFERTQGGWFSESLETNQKFKWQANSYSFRDIKSNYIWACTTLGTSEKITPNADFTLQSPIFDFTNIQAPYIEFDMIYLYYRGYDGVIIEYSDEKGQNWKKAQDVDYPETIHYNDLTAGPWFTGVNNSDKKPYSIRLNELAGKKAAIRFRVLMSSYQSNYLGSFIDNIHVDNAPYDIEVLSAELNAGSCVINNNNITFSAKIVNNFATLKEQLNVNFKILDDTNNVVYSKNEKSDFIFTKFKDTLSYSISNINLKTVGEHRVVFSVFPDDTTLDLKPENNTYTSGFDNWNNEDMKVSVLPYTMDFEDVSRFKGWRTTENKNSAGWKYGTSAELESQGWNLKEHGHFMASNDDKCKCDSSNDMLISPVFDLSNYKEAHLKFDGFGDGKRLSDGYVKVSTDGGKTWETVFKMYYINNWIEYHVNLTPYAGKPCVLVAFKHDDNGLAASGFAVDNIVLSDKAEHLQLSNLSIPEIYMKILLLMNFL